MTQVQLIIEQFFDKEIVWRYLIPCLDNNLKHEIEKKFCEKIIRLDEENESFYYLHTNESRQTIIEALWEYQKNLLPIKIKETPNFETIEELLLNSAFYDKFYDPETRIITITKFEEE